MVKETASRRRGLSSRGTSWKSRIWNDRYIYLMLLPGVVWYIIFHYGPMYGVLMAFQNFRFKSGILGSPWVGFKHFQRLFISPEFKTVLFNTIRISLTRLVVEFPMPIILAVMLTEVRFTRFGKVCQTVFTLPHFLSWVILGQIFDFFLGSRGTLNAIIEALGGQPMKFLTNPTFYQVFLYASNIWQDMGWGAIIFMATITNIDPQLYEAATVDGANRFRRIWHITLPGIREIAVVMLVLRVGHIMSGGFDQIFNTYNDSVRRYVNIIDTYVYNITFQSTPNYSFSAAVGLFKSVVNFFMLIIADRSAKWVSGSGLFGGGKNK